MPARETDVQHLAWFRRPAPDRPGTLNATYQLLDRAIVDGRADDVVLRDPGTEVSFATLLEETAALGGVLIGIGVVPGSPVAVRLAPERRAATALLAVSRIGAVLDDAADQVVTEEGVGDVPWDAVQKIGRTDPAPAAVQHADDPWTTRTTVLDLAEALGSATTPLSSEALVSLLTGRVVPGT
ncbi:MAG: hypothetical protein JWO46_2378 [Nocardioidaceae bacterium]|nr:hypothetical protein [Nocardioidaceae bacterium]